MRISHWSRILVAFLAAGALITSFLHSSPANAQDEHDGSSENSSASASVSSGGDGSATFSVEVLVEGVAGGGGSSSGPVTVQAGVPGWVHPVCWYEPSLSGADMAAYLDSPRARKDAAMLDRSSLATDLPGYKDHAQDTEGRWYSPMCSSQYAPDGTDYLSLARDYFSSHPSVFVPAGQEPPAPEIDPSVLAAAAWQSVTVPPPATDHNPRLTGSGATVVGVDTWVWATTATPRTLTVTATAATTTVTLTATSTGLSLQAPDSLVSCTGFGTPWTPDATTTDCSLTFTRSSAHLGGTTPLTVSTTYQATWTTTTGRTGTLPPHTTTTTTPLTVAEAQALGTAPTP